MNTITPIIGRECLREPIPEIAAAADMLKLAADAHLSEKYDRAAQLIHEANDPAIRDWTESIWGKGSPYAAKGTFAQVPAFVRETTARMPGRSIQKALHERDGYYCRFCGIPVIRREVREFLRTQYPKVNIWGKRNADQHAALQCMWAQYDHIIPHSRGGNNSIDNIVITCAPCNYGRMQYTVEEAGIRNPMDRSPKLGPWNGLECLLSTRHVA